MPFSDGQLFHYSLLTLYLISPPTIIALLFLTAPYGKHHRPGWGPSIPPPLAWCLMESPTIILTLLLFPRGANSSRPRGVVLIAPYFLHYAHRTLVYPLKMLLRSRTQKKQSSSSGRGGFPLSVAAMAFVFNVLNGYVQVRSVSEYTDVDGADGWWFWAVRVLIGGAVFVAGLVVNVWADNALLGLKEKGGGYKVPYGGLFEWVSCPNYLGEIIEWLGWAVMTWSWAGMGFFLYTCANLVPRAGASHRWYLDKFKEEYPKKRKAVIPFVY